MDFTRFDRKFAANGAQKPVKIIFLVMTTYKNMLKLAMLTKAYIVRRLCLQIGSIYKLLTNDR